MISANARGMLLGGIFALVIFAGTPGCRKERGDAPDRQQTAHGDVREQTSHAEEEHANAEVGFEKNLGLSLAPGIRAELGIAMQPVETGAIIARKELLAQVFEAQPHVLANATIPVGEAAGLSASAFEEARLLRIDRASVTATRSVDLIFEVQRTPAPKQGDFVKIVATSLRDDVLTVPSAALLEAASGTFVYRFENEHFQREAVAVGLRSPEKAEVEKGLRAGDLVVTSGVEQLWLIELKLTKGGGHSH